MIRQATRQDIPVLVWMMREYAKEAPIPALANPDTHNAEHVGQLIFQMLSGRGFILIDDDHRGMIAAIVTPNVWCPKILELRELAWWVMPEHRGKSIGGKLWIKFDELAQDMLNNKRVDFVCTTVMANSPLIDYTKRGYKPLEVTFFRD
jgi:N-acetylglutamate synthase-like GNAT family acetyltransferase